jgi:steroid delta-isomerase-like uncharacterized protein
MSIETALQRYFDAWNCHRPEAVVAALTDAGTYEDPTTGGALSGDALTASVAGVLAAFPDVHFEVVSVSVGSDANTASAQWRMQGTNTGPLPGGPATGGTLDLPGADCFTYDADADAVSSVVGYFDTATMLTQLGLQAHITPADMEPVTRFGYGLRVDSGRSTVPGAFTITWIEIDPEHQPTLVDATTNIVMEQLGNHDYLGSTIATIGRRNYTFTAWTTPDAAQAALRGEAHSNAMRCAQSGELGDDARGVTSMWTPLLLNGVFTPRAGSRDLAELGGQWL